MVFRGNYWLKRHVVYEFVITASGILRRSMDDERWMKRFPHHRLIHAIEASCAYSRKHNYDAINFNRVGRLMNVYHDYLIRCSRMRRRRALDHFVQLLHREQIELQFPPAESRAYARTWLCTPLDGALPRIDASFCQSLLGSHRLNGSSCRFSLR